jgi:4-hydroxy-2-oxoheptanedioate aldolase
MNKPVLLLSLTAAASLVLYTLDTPAAPPKPARINKAIELLEQGQPIYYTTVHGGYEEGRKAAQTWADYISYDMEHNAYDVARLREFMRGLVDGGPTPSGHRTPAVIPELPVGGLDEATMKANYWMVQQVLATGVHGILLCHARSPGAVRAFVRAARYPYQKLGVGNGLEEGLRGHGGHKFASHVWGIEAARYLEVADPWPLNPKGELLLGLKIEDRHAMLNAESSTRVPGVGFAEWGPGDMSMSFGLRPGRDEPYPQAMQDARTRVFSACKAAKIPFLHGAQPDTVEQLIDEGVRIFSSGREAAERGRRYTKRTVPW